MSWSDSNSPPLKGDTKPKCKKGCWCGCFYCYDTFFKDATVEHSPTYHMASVWGIHYPGQLHDALEKEGFVPAPNIPDGSPLCGWKRKLKIYETGVYRGWLDVNLKNGTSNSNLTYEQAPVDRVARVFRSQYPFVEIIVIFAVCVIPLVALISGGMFCAWYQERKQSMPDDGLARTNLMIKKQFKNAQELNSIALRQINTASHLVKTISRRKDWNSPPLLRMPNEIHLEILDRLHFHDLRQLRRSCRFYRLLISDDVLTLYRGEHVRILEGKDISVLPLHVPTHLPCWTCEQVKPRESFLTDTINYKFKDRQCTACQYKAGTIKAGKWYRIGGTQAQIALSATAGLNEMLICCRCKCVGFSRDPVKSRYPKNLKPRPNAGENNMCRPCETLMLRSGTVSGFMHMVQFIFCLITFSVASSGSFPYHGWAYGITVAMTTYCAMSRLLLLPHTIINKPMSWRLSTFALLEAVLWLGVLVGVTFEAVKARHSRHKFDHRAIATTFFIWMEFFLSAASWLICTDFYINWRQKRELKKDLTRR